MKFVVLSVRGVNDLDLHHFSAANIDDAWEYVEEGADNFSTDVLLTAAEFEKKIKAYSTSKIFHRGGTVNVKKHKRKR